MGSVGILTIAKRYQVFIPALAAVEWTSVQRGEDPRPVLVSFVNALDPATDAADERERALILSLQEKLDLVLEKGYRARLSIRRFDIMLCDEEQWQEYRILHPDDQVTYLQFVQRVISRQNFYKTKAKDFLHGQ